MDKTYNIIVMGICIFLFAFIMILVSVKSSDNYNIPSLSTGNSSPQTPANSVGHPVMRVASVCEPLERISETDAVINDLRVIERVLPASEANAPSKKLLLIDELQIDYFTKEYLKEVSDEEITYVATIVQLEVMGHGSSLYDFSDIKTKYWEMLAVAQCVRNRVECNVFPNSVTDVIFASHKSGNKIIYQFHPVAVLDSYTPTVEAITAVRDVFLNGVMVVPENYYYFCATKIEERFENINASCFIKQADGTYDKQRGHLTTFYAGRDE